MTVRILNRNDDSIIIEGETMESILRAALSHNISLRYANLNGADLSNANLSGADLRYADLRYANLSGADLTGANLSGADLTGANLYRANLSSANLRFAGLNGASLRFANLSGAFLRGAVLTEAKLNWKSHWLLGFLLYRASGHDIACRKLADLVAFSTDLCWENFMKLDDDKKEWALDILADYVVDGDNAPDFLKKRANIRKKESH